MDSATRNADVARTPDENGTAFSRRETQEVEKANSHMVPCSRYSVGVAGAGGVMAGARLRSRGSSARGRRSDRVGAIPAPGEAMGGSGVERIDPGKAPREHE